MAKMYSNSNHTSVSWNGEVFEAENGTFEVPDEALSDLMAHGLIPGEQPAPISQEPTVKARPNAQWSNDALLAKADELELGLPTDIQRPALITAVADALKAKE